MITVADRPQHWVMLALGSGRLLLRQTEMQLLQPSSNIIGDAPVPAPAIGGIRVSSVVWPVYYLAADFSAEPQVIETRPMCAIFRSADDCFGLAVDDADILELPVDSILPIPSYAQYASVPATGVLMKEGSAVFATDATALRQYLSDVPGSPSEERTTDAR